MCLCVFVCVCVGISEVCVSVSLSTNINKIITSLASSGRELLHFSFLNSGQPNMIFINFVNLIFQKVEKIQKVR